MTTQSGLADRQAQRLLRCYPPSWRNRYGEEFTELLIADLAERPRCWRRTADIARSGLIARLSIGGLGNSPGCQPLATLAVVGGAILGFFACGVSLWSQLLIGWRWSPPDSPAVTVGVMVMSVTVGCLAVLAVLASLPVLAAMVRAVRRHDARRLAGPLALIVVSLAILILGGHHLEAGWPGAGGHAWRFQRLVPAPLASLGWAETLGISAYWAHPGDLLVLPRLELGWMIVSPVSFGVAVAGAVNLVRRLSLSAAALRFEARIAAAAAIVMVPCLGAATWWVVASHARSTDVFRAGSLDLLLIAGMATALAVARTATRRLSAGATNQPVACSR